MSAGIVSPFFRDRMPKELESMTGPELHNRHFVAADSLAARDLARGNHAETATETPT
jgi:hypothetical protein